MANLKELRGRISSVKNTRKITSAMSRIAAARLRRAQNAVMAARPYGERLADVVSHLIAHVDPNDPSTHPLLEEREIQRVAVILMTADRGLCGGFNSNATRGALRFVEQQRKEGREVVISTVGRKGRRALAYAGESSTHEHAAPELEDLIEASKALASEAIAMFKGEDETSPRVDAVFLVHNRFVSVLSQVVETVQLVPFRPSEPSGEFELEPAFEPTRPELLAHLLPVAVESAIQQAMFDSVASEVAARRMAMDSATDNATQLIDELTLEYNRERQAAITTELMEIIGGAEALRG
jgi:F-type H+-transporting ATPase subunit gamma